MKTYWKGWNVTISFAKKNILYQTMASPFWFIKNNFIKTSWCITWKWTINALKALRCCLTKMSSKPSHLGRKLHHWFPIGCILGYPSLAVKSNKGIQYYHPSLLFHWNPIIKWVARCGIEICCCKLVLPKILGSWSLSLGGATRWDLLSSNDFFLPSQ